MAENEESAVLKLYENYEHIKGKTVTKTKQVGVKSTKMI